MLSIIIALLVVFICLYAAGLVVYAIFFAIHKSNFRRLIHVIKRYNELITGLNAINIYKIQVLANNDIGSKFDLNKYINIYWKLKENSTLIKNNIRTSELQLNAFNLKISKRYIAKINRDLDQSLKALTELQHGYANYTQYGNAIEATFQNYLEIFERISDFYFSKLEYTKDFKRINVLIVAISKTFESLPKLSTEFNYKKTIDTTLDLGRKLKTLADIVLLTYRFQLIANYLKTTKEYNEKMISNHFEEIDRGDLQTLHNLLTVFTHAYNGFIQNYRALQLGKAQEYTIRAIETINQVNQFTYIHVKTPTLIALSLNEIKEQSDKIISNKGEIVKCINDLKQYFVLEPEINQCFKSIEKNINDIDALNHAASNVNYQTHVEKINAVKKLDYIANQIVNRKADIINCINNVDDLLGKVIKVVTDLNDLHIQFLQLRAIVTKCLPSNEEKTQLLELIDNNLSTIKDYLQQIINNEKPDFDKIAYEISSIIEQDQQIYNRVTNSVVLSAYANRLFTYVNRYKKIKDLKPDFDKASKLIKDKQYAQCIDTLLHIWRLAKKHK